MLKVKAVSVKSVTYKKSFPGLSSCVEIQHPMDELPPLFQCDLCKHSAAHKEILPHVIGRNHRLEFFVCIVLVC